MFKVRRALTIRSHYGPTIGQHASTPCTSIDHRLKRQGHTRFELRPSPGSCRHIVQDLRRLMHVPTDPVSRVLTYDAETVRLDASSR